MESFELVLWVFSSPELAASLQGFGRRVVAGLVVGSIFALAGVGLTLVYGILRLANFAHGDFLTLGTYLALYFVALITLPATLRWGLGAALLLILLVAADRYLRPWWVRRRGSGEGAVLHKLSATESALVLYAAAALVALVAGNRFPVGVPSAWVAFIVALAAAGVLVWRLLSSARDQAAGGRQLLAWVGFAVVAVAAAHFLVPLQTGPGGFSFPGEIAIGLVVLAVGALRSKRDAGEDPAVLGVLGLTGLVALYLLATPILLAVTLALAIVAAVSVVLDLVMWRRARAMGAGLVTLIIMAIGLALVIRNSIIVLWGGGLKGFPGVLRRGEEILGTGVLITPNQAIVIGVTVLVALLLHFLLQHTRVGKAMRALSDDMELARVSGIDVDRVVLYVWIVGGVLVALAGILYGMTRAFTPSLGWHQLLPIFAAVILGGIGSAYGAMVGGFAIGLAMETSVFFGVPSEYRLAVGFGILILVMIFRPRGIFGRSAVR